MTAAKINQYQRLLNSIQKELGDNESQVEEYTTYAKVEEAWSVGELIALHLLQNKERAGHKEKLFEQLSDDLERGVRLLRHYAQFYRVYPKLPPKNFLSWSHYRRLVSVSDNKKRKILEAKVLAEKLGAYVLDELIREQRGIEKKVVKFGKKISSTRGQLYVYRTISVSKGCMGKKTVMIDCGFSMRIQKPLEDKNGIKNGFVIFSKNSGLGYQIQYSTISRDQLYTYKAYVQRIVDGDTLVVNVDCGFDMFTQQKLRLRGIDSPEISKVAGKRAKRFVEDRLKKCKFIVIKTYKEGKYGRYISDVFYSKHLLDPQKIATKGQFLNQELVDYDLAKIYR